MCNALRVTGVGEGLKVSEKQRPKILTDKINSALLWIVRLEVKNLWHNLHIGLVVLFRRNSETNAFISEDHVVAFFFREKRDSDFGYGWVFFVDILISSYETHARRSNQIKQLRIENNHCHKCFCSVFYSNENINLENKPLILLIIKFLDSMAKKLASQEKTIP